MRERDRGENEIAVSTVVKKRELLTCDLSLDLSLVQRRTWALRSGLVSILKVAYRLIYLNLSKHYHRLMYLRCFFCFVSLAPQIQRVFFAQH